METEPTTIITFGSELLNLLPVIIGGLLTISGTFAGAFLTHKLNQKSSKNKVKREKLEQLVDAAYRTIHWLDENRKITLLDKSKDIGSCPISEVEYLSKLYIPELKKEVATMSVATSNMNLFISESNIFKLTNKDLPKDFVKNFKYLYEELLHATTELIEKASVVAEDL